MVPGLGDRAGGGEGGGVGGGGGWEYVVALPNELLSQLIKYS